MIKWLCGFVFILASLVVSAEATQSSDESAKSDKPSQSAEAAEPAAVTQIAKAELESDKSVLEFVREHQPELADLLSFLKKKKSKDYDVAMRESRKVRERLLSIKARDSELYDVELAIWKNSAQIRLLAAAVSAKSRKLNEQDHARLEELIKHENKLNIQRLSLEKARLESRLNQLSQQLTRRQDQSENVIAKSMKVWENRIERSKNKP